MKFLHSAIPAIVLVSTVTVHAQAVDSSPPAYSQEEQALCQPDVFRLCNDAVPDEAQIAVCMKANRKQLSPECRRVLDAHAKKRK